VERKTKLKDGAGAKDPIGSDPAVAIAGSKIDSVADGSSAWQALVGVEETEAGRTTGACRVSSAG
jgi:hypothetical protein